MYLGIITDLSIGVIFTIRGKIHPPANPDIINLYTQSYISSAVGCIINHLSYFDTQIKMS